MKLPYNYLLTAILVAIAPMLFFGTMYYLKQEANSFDFKRNVLDSVKGINVQDLKHNSYYIAGQKDDEIFLGNHTATGKVLKVNIQSGKIDTAMISLDQKDYHETGTYRLTVDSANFYLSNGIARSILQGRTYIWKAIPTPVHISYFQQSVALNPNSIVFSYISTKTNENTLRKELTGKHAIEDVRLKKQVDGVFCTGGMLGYNTTLNLITYIYSYRNQILLIDTNMQLVKMIKTIDPIDTARIKVSRINSEQASKINPDALLVNAQAVNWKTYLFVQSKLKGKQEDIERFNHAAVIDVYDLKIAKYCYSLYLPQYQSKPLKQLMATDGFIIGISDHYLIKYPVRLPDRGK